MHRYEEEMLEHRYRVSEMLEDAVSDLLERGRTHAMSALQPPEAGVMNPRLLFDMLITPEDLEPKDVVENHRLSNTYCPEWFWTFPGNVSMTLMDLLHLVCTLLDLCVWRNEEGDSWDLDGMFDALQRHYGYSDELTDILRETAFELWSPGRERALHQDFRNRIPAKSEDRG